MFYSFVYDDNSKSLRVCPKQLWRNMVHGGHSCLYAPCTVKSGYSLFGRPPFIPTKAAQWHIKQKCLDFPGLEIPGSDGAFPHHWAHRASALETLLLRLRVIQVEPAASGLALR